MVHYKLSPNEEARILKEEREKRRILRLQQVREQAKINAAKLRQSVKNKKEELTEAVAENLEKEWDTKQQEKLYHLKAAYEQSLQGLGESHRKAVDENPEWQQECREMLELQENDRAEERHQAAIQRHRQELEERQQEEQRHIMNRLMALDIEKSRAQKIASLPKPKPDPVENIELIKFRPVKFTDRDAFATSRYHIPETIVEKENYQHQADAKSSAVAEDEKYKDVEDEKKRVQHERAEKARLRHKVAVEKELLKHDYTKLMHDLSDLQRADLNRRRQTLEKLPKQIFLAPHRRVEEKEERQLNMERAFEDMYMAATDCTGDLSLALDPHPVVPSATPSLDVTTEIQLSEEEEESFSRTGTISKEALGVMSDQRSFPLPTQPPCEDVRSASLVQVEPKTTFEVPSEQGEISVSSRSRSNLFSGRTSSSNLRKVFDKIKAQREEWIRQSIQESPEKDRGRDTESIGTEPKSLSQYTISSSSGDSPIQPIRPLPHQISGSTYSLSGGTMSTMSDGGADFNTPPVAEDFHVRQRLSSGSSGRPSVSDAGSLASNVSHVTPSSAGSQISYEHKLTSLNHPDMGGIGRQHRPTSDVNSGLRSVNGDDNAVKHKIELQQKEFERQRKEYEDQLKMLEEKKRRLQQHQRLSDASGFYRDEASQRQNCLLADQNGKTQPHNITGSTASTEKSYEHGNSAKMCDSETHIKSKEPLYSNDTVRNPTSKPQLSCDNSGSTFGTGSLSTEGSRSGAGSLLADGLGLNRNHVKRYQEELLQRQANQPTAVALAREKLQLRAQQLLEKSASRPSSNHTLSLSNTSSTSSESNTDRLRSGVCGNELSAILETSERLELSARPIRLDRYVSPSEDHSDSVLRDFLEDSSPLSSMLTRPSNLTQPPVASEDPMVRNASGRTYDFSLGEGVSTNMPHTVSKKHWQESSVKPTQTNESRETDQSNKSESVTSGGRQEILNQTNVGQFLSVSHPVVYQVSSYDDFAPRILDKTQKAFLDSLSSTKIVKSLEVTSKDSEAERNFLHTFSERPFVLKMAHSSETSTHPKETEHSDQSLKSAQLQAVTQTYPLEQKNWNFQSRLSQNSVKHHSDIQKDANGSLSQYTMSTDSRSWGSHIGSDHSPISVDHRTLLADLDYREIDDNDSLDGSQTVCVETSEQIVDNETCEKVVDSDSLIGGLNVEGRMFVDHHSCFKDQRSNTSCPDQEFSLPYKKVEHYDILSQDVPVSVLPKQATLESQTGSAVSGEKFCNLESDEEDNLASHGLISYSGNVYQEWRPLVRDESPKTSASEHSQQVEQNINTKTQDAPEGITGGPVNELVIAGKGTFKEPNASTRLHTLDLHREESVSTCKDESVRAGYWSFHGFQGVRAFHTASSDMQFENRDPLQDDTTFPTVLEESKSSESEKCASEKLPQFPLPNMQSTLIDEEGNETPETSPSHVQNPEADLSQHSFTGSLNSRLSSEAGLGLHFKRNSNPIRSIPPCSHNRSEGVVPLENSSAESVNHRSSEPKHYQPEFYSLVAHTSGDYRSHELSGDEKMHGFTTSGSFPVQNDPTHLRKTVSSFNSKSCDVDLRKQGIAAAASCEQDSVLSEETNGSTCTRNKWGEIFETYRSTNTASKSGVVYDVSKYETKAQKNILSELCDDEQQMTLKVSANEEDDTDENSSRSHSFDILASEPGILDEPELTLVSASSPTMSSYGMFSQSSTPMRKNLESSSLLSFEHHELSAKSTSLTSRSAQFTEHSEQKKLPPRSRNGSSQVKDINNSAASDKVSRFLSPAEMSKTSDGLQRPEDQSKDKEPASETDDWLNSTGNSESGSDGVSLQSAFMTRKRDFIAKSLQRVVEAKEKAKTSQSDRKLIENQQHLTKTVSSYIKSRAVHEKQGSQLSQDTGNISETSSEGRKLAEKAMKNRTARLYNQLEEVKQKKEEDDRKAFYAQNREKRRDFEKKHSESKKKKPAKK